MRYNVQKIITGPQEHVIDDLVIMPNWIQSQKMGQKGPLICQQKWFLELCKGDLPGFMAPALEMYAHGFLERQYAQFRNQNKKEPEWFDKLSVKQKSYVRWDYWIRGDEDRDEDCCMSIPGFASSGIGYMVKSSGFVPQVCDAFNLGRLHEVRQLGFLHDPTIRAAELSVHASIFSHTRFLHSLDTGVLATLIGLNNGLCPRDLLHLKTVAYSHDWRTPAGGDTMKAVDAELFDEDAHYGEAFAKPEFKSFKKKFGLSERLLSSIIRQEGVLGRALDLADKISYITRDVDYLMMQNPEKMDVPFCYEFRKLVELVASDPFICTLWDCAVIKDNELVLSNPDRLAKFLKLRALMFRALYYNPASRFLEDGLVKIVARYLFRKGIITLENLLTRGDNYLMEMMDKVVGKPYFFSSVSGILEPAVERFPTLRAALERERQLSKITDIMTNIDVSHLTKSSGLASFKVLEEGKIQTLAESRPNAAKEIKAITRTSLPYFLYIYSTSHLRLPKDLALELQKDRLARLNELTAQTA